MGAYEGYIDGIISSTPGVVPFGGTLIPTSSEFGIVLAQQIKGGTFPVPTLEVLVDLPNQLLSLNMEVIVAEHERPDGSIMPKTRFSLKKIPAGGQRVSEIVDYDLYEYWDVVNTGNLNDTGSIEVQYAPNFEGKRPLFLPTVISPEAYQAGYPNDDTYQGGNPADKIWADTYDPQKNHVWMRQRIGVQDWGIPISIAEGTEYEANQYIDVIFRWVPKLSPAPPRPVQPIDYQDLPVGWQATPGDDYETQILTEDLYYSQAVKNPYGVLKSPWSLPILVSSDPQLVRYGNEPGNTDFLDDDHWRGYYTPGLDTFMATRSSGVSTDWTVTKLDQESGEFPDFVFKVFPLSVTQEDLEAARPTSPIPIGGDAPNDWSDGPPPVGPTEIRYASKTTKFSDGSLKQPWSFPYRFDGMDSIQALIEETPGDVFFKARNVNGNLVYAFNDIPMVARLYRGLTELTTGITEYKWYRGATLIVFSGVTFKATNLGGLNNYHTISPDGKTLTINPEAVDVTQQYKVGIVHNSRPTEYSATKQIRDAADDGAAFMADILPINGTTFKNQTGLYRFDSTFFKGGLVDIANVVFTWSIIRADGSPLTNGLRNAGGVPIGDTNVAAATVYVNGADIDQFATLILTGTFGEVVRISRQTLTDVEDATAIETLYWGSGSVYPGNPTDFLPRTLTKAEVLALGIGYSEDATGRWWMIQRIDGVWGGEIQMRNEASRPNGGIAMFIYKNIDRDVAPAPAAPAVPGAGSIIPAGWTAVPAAYVGGEDTTYMTSCLFLLRTDVAADPSVLTRDNYTPLGTYGTPVRITGIDGATPPPVTPATNGWSPYLLIEADGNRRVLKLQDWIGGSGAKPAGAGGSSSYIGAAGLTTIGAAIDIRGTQGIPGVGVNSVQIQDSPLTGATADSSVQNFVGGSWTNDLGVACIVAIKMGCRFSNGPTLDGMARMTIYVTINGTVVPSQGATFYYPANIPADGHLEKRVQVLPGQTIAWSGQLSALKNSPNNLCTSPTWNVIAIV